MYFGPELNDGRHVFVFGSNLAGRHGAGAALEALKHWGAEPGIGRGFTGQSYALPTKDAQLRTRNLLEIRAEVDWLKNSAELLTDKTFLVTMVGCGLAGHCEDDIAPMFLDSPPNMILPDGWRPINYWQATEVSDEFA